MDRKMDVQSSRKGVWKFWQKGPIYSCRAHIATSFVPTTKLVGKEILEQIRRFWERMVADSRGARVRLVVSSSCTVVRCQFLGRTVRMVLQWVLGVGSPRCMGDQWRPVHECAAIMRTFAQGGTKFGKIGAHGMHACSKHSRAYVHGYVSDSCA